MHQERPNAAYQDADQQIEARPGNRVALHFEGEAGDSRDVSHAQLACEVGRAVRALRELGVRVGDLVALHLPMIPETVVALLACDRIGAVPMALADCPDLSHDPGDGPTRRRRPLVALVVTADGGYDRGRPVAWKAAVDRALADRRSAPPVLVVRRTGQSVAWARGRDHWWHELTERRPAEHLSPESVDRSAGGAGATPLGLRPVGDVYWCTADSDWIIANSAVVHGPFAAGATQVICEDPPGATDRGRLWEIVQRHGVTVLHTAPDAFADLLRWGDDAADGFDLSRLRILGSIGESVRPELWYWHREHLSGGRTSPWELRTCAAPWSPQAQRRPTRLYAIR
ncbi:hypothetical protein GCM10009665_14840 [Kitasatospora nipponensis]|uniref:AMP-dependent synthetase/ligase domain-containing protein n=1 Tax=Kitasatospora nipponensis TaxID=258049 RepID=A0ABP4GMQ8_9ACTN